MVSQLPTSLGVANVNQVAELRQMMRCIQAKLTIPGSYPVTIGYKIEVFLWPENAIPVRGRVFGLLVVGQE